MRRTIGGCKSSLVGEKVPAGFASRFKDRGCGETRSSQFILSLTPSLNKKSPMSKCQRGLGLPVWRPMKARRRHRNATVWDKLPRHGHARCESMREFPEMLTSIQALPCLCAVTFRQRGENVTESVVACRQALLPRVRESELLLGRAGLSHFQISPSRRRLVFAFYSSRLAPEIPITQDVLSDARSWLLPARVFRGDPGA